MPSLTVSNIDTGLPYTFEIQYVLNDITVTPPSGTVAFTSSTGASNITYPQGVTVPSKITSLTWVLVNNTSVKIDWVPPASNGKPILGYIIWGISESNIFIIGVVSNRVNSATITELINTNKTYRIALSAYNEVGVGQPSDVITITNTIPYPPPPPPPVHVPCFVEGQKILTNSGFKCVQNLSEKDRIITSDGRHVLFKLYKTKISNTDRNTAPYYIPAHTFKHNVPSTPLTLSPLHAIQIRKGLWHIPQYAALEYSEIKQINVGQPITYYHIELPNYFTDNIILEGNTIVESYASNQTKGIKNVYKYNSSLGFFTRQAHNMYSIFTSY